MHWFPRILEFLMSRRINIFDMNSTTFFEILEMSVFVYPYNRCLLGKVTVNENFFLLYVECGRQFRVVFRFLHFECVLVVIR